jgi:carboxyl-terminal processing protease
MTALGVGTVLLVSTQRGGGAAGEPLISLSARGDAGYSLSDLRYFRRVAQKINSEYVDPTRVEPEVILRGALDRVARSVPEFLYEMDEDKQTIKLVAGEAREELGLPRIEGLTDVVLVADKVAALLDRSLSPEVERPAIEYALMNGMLSTLDPHSIYINPESYKEMSITNKGHFGGLGITIGLRGPARRLTILYPLKDTPAWRAGLSAGDRIDKIGNESTVNMGLQEAVSKLRGAVGSAITITVSSDDDRPDRAVTIVRARIEVPSVEWAYAGDGIGLIQILHFSQTTYETVEDALEELDSKAIEDRRGKLSGLVLDLRGNPGGYLQQAIEVADKFISSGTLVTTVGLGGSTPDVTRATRFRTEDELPIVVLVDASSASASEIVAGALQNQDRALVMGSRTFGKGSVQNLYDRDFHDGALKMTIAKYLTPGDVSIQGQGIQPDIELRPAVVPSDGDAQLYWQDFELREEDLDHSFAWGSEEAEGAASILRSVYSCPECFDAVGDASAEEGVEEQLSDPSIQAAKALLLRRPSDKRSVMLESAADTLGKHFAEREKTLVADFKSVGVDWSLRGRRLKSFPGSDKVKVELQVGSEDGLLTPGRKTPVKLKVTNEGNRPVQRLRAVTRGEFFQGREYFFGRIDAHESREYSVAAKPQLWADPRAHEVTWHFFAEDGPVPDDFKGRLRIHEIPHPRFAYSWQVIDDGSGSSRGNGDGLVQPEEQIDLLVTVRNIGTGPTAGLWKRASGTESEVEAVGSEHGTEDDKKLGFIRVKNKSGEALFLTSGNDSFQLKAGEQSHHRLSLKVLPAAASGEKLELQLIVGDEEFYEFVSSDIELPVFSASAAIVPMDRLVRSKTPGLAVHGGASDLTPQVATLNGLIQVTGQLGGWYRVALPWSGSGWLPAEQVEAASGEPAADALAVFLPNSPPVLELSEHPGGLVVTAGTLSLSGRVIDDTEVKDLFLFVNDRKVHYERVAAGSSSHEFSYEVELDAGENRIEIFARDDAEHLGSLVFGVYRASSRAELQVPVQGPAPVVQ